MMNEALQQRWQSCHRFTIAFFLLEGQKLIWSTNLSLASSLTSRDCLKVILKSRFHMISQLSRWPYTNLQFHVSDTLSIISTQHGPAHFPNAPTKKPNNFKKNFRTITTKPQDTKMSQMCPKAVDGVERLVTASSPENRTAFLATVSKLSVSFRARSTHRGPHSTCSRTHINLSQHIKSCNRAGVHPIELWMVILRLAEITCWRKLDFFWWKKTVAVDKMMSLSSRLGNVQGTLNTKIENESERTTDSQRGWRSTPVRSGHSEGWRLLAITISSP